MASGSREGPQGRRDSGFRVARRVLVFEGRPATLTPLVEILVENGYLVQMATDWTVIVEKLGSFAPHAVLVDLDVPRPVVNDARPRVEFSGFPFASFPPIIGFSSRVQTPRLRVAAMIAKPIVVEDLLRVLAMTVHDEIVRRTNRPSGASSSGPTRSPTR